MRITVDVKTGVKEESIEKLEDNYYLVKVRSQRKKGKANTAVLRLLRKHFGCSVWIVSGHSSSRKIIELDIV